MSPTPDSEVRLLLGDCLDVMRGGTADSIDAIVTDPPYGLGFMGKKWDDLPPGREWADECLRVLKPGGHLLAFGGTRTYHRLAVALEDAGFEIRDCLAWMYGQGFPKSLDVSKAIDKAARAERHVVGYDESKARPNKENFAKRNDRQPGAGAAEGWKDNGATVTAPATEDAVCWQGWGTALKPAFEPIVLARKPLVGTVVANVLEHGTGAINVDGCRIEASGRPHLQSGTDPTKHGSVYEGGDGIFGSKQIGKTDLGRWPANVLLDEEAAALLNEQTGTRRSSGVYENKGQGTGEGVTYMTQKPTGAMYSDSGGASRFFYVAKASKKERNAGLERFPAVKSADDSYGTIQQPQLDRAAPRENWSPHKTANNHPTVKPIALMRWLVRLVTPPGGRVLDPFMGSGTTGIACVLEGFGFVGIEVDPEYVEIARARIEHWREP